MKTLTHQLCILLASVMLAACNSEKKTTIAAVREARAEVITISYETAFEEINKPRRTLFDASRSLEDSNLQKSVDQLNAAADACSDRDKDEFDRHIENAKELIDLFLSDH